MMADLVVTAKADEAVKVAIAAIEKEEEAGKADLAEETAKANTVVIGKAAEAKRAVIVARADGAAKAVIVVTGKAEVAEAAKAAMAEIVRVEEAERVDLAEIGKAAVMVDMEASPEGAEASTGTAQKIIPVMTSGGQGKNHEASLGQDLTALNS